MLPERMVLRTNIPPVILLFEKIEKRRYIDDRCKFR